ncbi:MAG: helix-turn-helix transcriptional regulator [Chloroflexaceae bacterium]|nr:helix-turn-helix transcriptional regulator [Chloroflexaceae bacterium]
MRSNMYLLMGRKAQRENRRITLRTVADETNISYYTVNAIATERIREYPKDVLAELCTYFQCGVGDLLTLADVPDLPVEGGK